MQSNVNRTLSIIIGIILVLFVGALAWYALNFASSPLITGIQYAPSSATHTYPSSATVTAPVVTETSSTIPVNTTPNTATGKGPTITGFEPGTGASGDIIRIKGSNFSESKNYITFGPSKGLHHFDGTPDNVVTVSLSINNTVVAFPVPTSTPYGNLCDAQNQCSMIAGTKIEPGTYPVTVYTADGTSNTLQFTVTQ